jgi:hypothetical protein
MNAIRRLVTRSMAFAVVGLGLASTAAHAQTPLSFYPLNPCRLWDTRSTHAPAIGANTSRSFVARGLCGVPAAAQAVAVNVTIVSPTDTGNLRIFPAGITAPLASLLNWAATDFAVANGTIVRLGTSGANHLTVQVDMPPASTGQVHVLADVTGYFQ